MGLTHQSNSPIRWNYTVETKHVTSTTDIDQTWFVVYQQSMNIDTGKPVGVQEICRSKVRMEANKIRDMYTAITPADKQMPKFISIEQRKHTDQVRNIRACTLTNDQMLKLIELLFKVVGMPADVFHKALTGIVAPTLIATRLHVNTSLSAPAIAPGEPEGVVAERAFIKGFKRALE